MSQIEDSFKFLGIFFVKIMAKAPQGILKFITIIARSNERLICSPPCHYTLLEAQEIPSHRSHVTHL